MWISILIDVLVEVMEIALKPIFDWFTRSIFPWILLAVSIACVYGYLNY